MPEKRAEDTTGLRVLAVLMALALWGFVGISQHHLVTNVAQKRLALAIKINNPPPGSRFRLEPQFADVTVEGPSKALDKLTEGDLSAFVDLKFHVPDAGRAQVHVSVPEGMKYQVAPEAVALLTRGKRASGEHRPFSR